MTDDLVAITDILSSLSHCVEQRPLPFIILRLKDKAVCDSPEPVVSFWIEWKAVG